jgi:hypothetical protein
LLPCITTYHSYCTAFRTHLFKGAWISFVDDKKNRPVKAYWELGIESTTERSYWGIMM